MLLHILSGADMPPVTAPDPLVQPLVWAPSLEPSALATQSPNDTLTCLVWDSHIP